MGPERVPTLALLEGHARLRDLLVRARSEVVALVDEAKTFADRDTARAAELAREAIVASEQRTAHDIASARSGGSDRLKVEVIEPINSAMAFLGLVAADWASPD